MENTHTIDAILWFTAGIITSGMIAFLLHGWWKGNYWDREMKLKKRQTQR